MFNWLFGSVSKLEHNIALETIAELEDRLEKLENRVFDIEKTDRNSIEEDDCERIVETYLDRHLYDEVKGILRDVSVSIDL